MTDVAALSAAPPKNLLEFLEQIQLENFWNRLRDDLQITQISHFDYVQANDLEKIGMSKPAIRRLLDKIDKHKKQKNINKLFSILPFASNANNKASPSSSSSSSSTTSFNSSGSKLYNTSIVKSEVKKSVIEQAASKTKHEQSTSGTPVLIRSSDIQILRDSKGEDQILGVGHFGIVKKAVWSTSSGAKNSSHSKKTVAVKFLHHKGGQDTNSLINEIACMCGLDHENLIKLHGIVLDFKHPHQHQQQKPSNGIVMVTELAAYGSLYNYLRRIRKKKNILPVKKLYSYVYQIAAGMEYLEGKSLIHRDLACRNILLTTTDLVKICDFGMTRNVDSQNDGAYMMTDNHMIPCAWYPPESIRKKLFSSKSDCWMFAVTAWEVFTLCDHPWANMNAVQILNAIENEQKQLAIPYLCSRNFYTIFQDCWRLNASERPTFQAIRQQIEQLKLIDMRAKENFHQEDKLEILKNDQITIIEGAASRHWWKGQNQRTLLFGTFPRAILDPQRQLNSEDISLPLKNSFIHTGHMSAQGTDKNWGHPGTIDEIFLNNPMDPPDLIDDSNSDSKFKLDTYNSRPVEIVPSLLSNPTANQPNLINLSDIPNETGYQDYSVSIDSFSSAKSASPCFFNNLPNSYYNNNPNQQNIDFNPMLGHTIQQSQPTASYINEGYHNQPLRPPPRPEPPLTASNHLVIPNQGFQACNTIQPAMGLYKTYKTIEVSSSNSLGSSNNSQRTDSDASSLQTAQTEHEQPLDLFLNKVMNDVMKDFDNVKLNASTLNNQRKLH